MERMARGFSDGYGALLRSADAVRDAPPVSEQVVQRIWFDRVYSEHGLKTQSGRAVRVVSPGWWNRQDGPDFRSAQLLIGGRAVTGDVEVHVAPGAWEQHGHHRDPGYDDVALEVVLDDAAGRPLARTSKGRAIPRLALAPHLERDLHDLAETLMAGEPGSTEPLVPGRCGARLQELGPEAGIRMLEWAGEWRMLAKARRLRDRMDQAGDDQALYEAAFEACGYSRYKRQFGTLARHLPYDRARQLTRRDPRLVEAALLHIGGLLPEASDAAAAPDHLEALQELRAAELAGLRSAGLPWERGGVRPINYPERRIAGFALFISRTAQAGLAASLSAAWEREQPRATRAAFEGMFPPALGFWATRCTWTGKPLPRPVAPIGAGRVRAIIGNVFIPFALADARRRRDRIREERVFTLYAQLPKEPDNRIVKAMIPRFFGAAKPPRLGFRAQQGLLQLYADWCELNPSCANCRIPTLLAQGGPAGPAK